MGWRRTGRDFEAVAGTGLCGDMWQGVWGTWCLQARSCTNCKPPKNGCVMPWQLGLRGGVLVCTHSAFILHVEQVLGTITFADAFRSSSTFSSSPRLSSGSQSSSQHPPGEPGRSPSVTSSSIPSDTHPPALPGRLFGNQEKNAARRRELGRDRLLQGRAEEQAPQETQPLALLTACPLIKAVHWVYCSSQQ